MTREEVMAGGKRIFLHAPPPDPTSYEPLPHGAKPMWLSLEEYLQLYAIECRREKSPINYQSISKWIDLWYGDLKAHVLVDCGPKGIIPYGLTSIYPEDIPDLRRLRRKRD